MKHIRKFQNAAAYSAATIYEPGVSMIIDENYKIVYDPRGSQPTPPVPQHDYVEIAGIKWATCNIGADHPYETGLYFQWGDTQGYTASQVGYGEGKKYFWIDDYKFHATGSGLSMTKYNQNDTLTILESEDDAVKQACGGNWRMPTDTESKALIAAVNTAWTEDYNSTGVAGMILTDKTDSSKVLFFPAAGWASTGSLAEVGDVCVYWTSLVSPKASYGPYEHAYAIKLSEQGIGSGSGDGGISDYEERYCGAVIRGILCD